MYLILVLFCSHAMTCSTPLYRKGPVECKEILCLILLLNQG